MVRKVLEENRPLMPTDEPPTTTEDETTTGKKPPKPGSTVEIKKREATTGTGNVNASDPLEDVMNDTDPPPRPTPPPDPPDQPDREEPNREHPGETRDR
jgi:hypothetical protein